MFTSDRGYKGENGMKGEIGALCPRGLPGLIGLEEKWGMRGPQGLQGPLEEREVPGVPELQRPDGAPGAKGSLLIITRFLYVYPYLTTG